MTERESDGHGAGTPRRGSVERRRKHGDETVDEEGAGTEDGHAPLIDRGHDRHGAAAPSGPPRHHRRVAHAKGRPGGGAVRRRRDSIGIRAQRRSPADGQQAGHGVGPNVFPVVGTFRGPVLFEERWTIDEPLVSIVHQPLDAWE